MIDDVQSEIDTQTTVCTMRESVKTEAKASVSHPGLLTHESMILRTDLTCAAFMMWKLCIKAEHPNL